MKLLAVFMRHFIFCGKFGVFIVFIKELGFEAFELMRMLLELVERAAGIRFVYMPFSEYGEPEEQAAFSLPWS